jgi:hypothetical protein
MSLSGSALGAVAVIGDGVHRWVIAHELNAQS